MSTSDKVHEILKGLARRKRSGGPVTLPLRDGDGLDISAAGGVSGTFGVSVRSAGLTQQGMIQRLGVSMSVRDDGNHVVEVNPAPVLQYLLDEALLVSARLPVVNANGELDACVLNTGWKDAGEAYELLDQNLDLPLGQLVVNMIFEHYIRHLEAERTYLDKTLEELDD